MEKIIEIENEKIYNGCLNSFVIAKYIKGIDVSYNAKKYCKKYDCDGLILLDQNNHLKDTAFKMIFYNRDGSNGYMCGNGIRCLMVYAYDIGLVKDNITYKIDTTTGIYECKIASTNPFIVEANLGKPSFDAKLLSLDCNSSVINQEFEIDDYKLNLTCIFLTTHHAVIIIKDKEELELIKNAKIGEKLKVHPFFKKGINCNFVYVIDEENIFLQTCERGVGWTLACGTGACASFAVLNMLKLVKNHVCAHFVKGSVEVLKNANDEIILIGPAKQGKE